MSIASRRFGRGYSLWEVAVLYLRLGFTVLAVAATLISSGVPQRRTEDLSVPLRHGR